MNEDKTNVTIPELKFYDTVLIIMTNPDVGFH